VRVLSKDLVTGLELQTIKKRNKREGKRSEIESGNDGSKIDKSLRSEFGTQDRSCSIEISM